MLQSFIIFPEFSDFLFRENSNGLHLFAIKFNNFIDNLLPSANEVCEGYVFTPVILFTVGESASVHAWIPTPLPGSRHPPSRPDPPGPDPPRTRHPWDQTPHPPTPRSRHPPHPGVETVTAADDTHPTGMYSCCG